MPASARVLVVDDDDLVRDILARVLDVGELSVCTADDGESALDLIREEPPDAVVLDVGLPGMDGFEVCRRLATDPALSSIPVVLLTGYDDEVTRDQATAAGCAAFLTKPFSALELLDVLRDALNGSSTPGAR